MSPRPLRPVARAALWMSGALASFMAMAVAGRELAAELSTFQILFFRSVVGLAAVTILLQRSGWTQVRTRVLRTHLVRNIAHFGGQYGWFYGLALIPLTEVFAIELVPALPHWVWPSAAMWPWVFVVALTALSAHYCLARAFQLADATVVVPMDFLRLPLIAVIGLVLYGERLQVWVVLGAAIILTAAWLNLRSAQGVGRDSARNTVQD